MACDEMNVVEGLGHRAFVMCIPVCGGENTCVRRDLSASCTFWAYAAEGGFAVAEDTVNAMARICLCYS